jgi:hypothetical protein
MSGTQGEQTKTGKRERRGSAASQTQREARRKAYGGNEVVKRRSSSSGRHLGLWRLSQARLEVAACARVRRERRRHRAAIYEGYGMARTSDPEKIRRGGGKFHWEFGSKPTRG